MKFYIAKNDDNTTFLFKGKPSYCKEEWVPIKDSCIKLMEIGRRKHKHIFKDSIKNIIEVDLLASTKDEVFSIEPIRIKDGWRWIK